MQNNTTTHRAPSPGCQKSATWKFRRGFTQIPDQAAVLPLPVQGFLRLLVQRSRFVGCCLDTIKELAQLSGISYKTAKRYMAILKTTKVPGFDHPFVTVANRRIYPVNHWGEEMAPVDPVDPVEPGVKMTPPGGQKVPSPDDRAPYIDAPAAKDLERENVNVGTLGPETACIQTIAEPVVDQVVEAAEQPAPEPMDGFDPTDPNADLEAMSDEQLQQVVDNPDRSIEGVARQFMARAIIRDRKAPQAPRKVRIDPPAAPSPSAAPQAAKGPGQLKFETLVGRLLTPTATDADVEALARRLAADLHDPTSMGYFVQLAKRLRKGEVKSKVVMKAYVKARSGCPHSPGAVFVWYVKEHSA